MPVGCGCQFAGVLAVNPDECRAGAGPLAEDEPADGAGLRRTTYAAAVVRLSGRQLRRSVGVQMDDLASHVQSVVGLSIQLAIRSTACASMPT